MKTVFSCPWSMVLFLVVWASLCIGWCNASTVDRVGDKYFCNGECDIERTRCSCKSSCKENRTCCTDYTESCEGGSSWTTTECTSTEDMTCPDGYGGSAPVVLLSIDGYRDIYFYRNHTPTITKLASCGVSVPYMISSYPTKTFPNHYSIATGLYPESHGIIANKMYNHDLEEEFRLGREASFKPHWWRGEPIWVSASNQNLKSAAYFWPGSDVNITRYPDYYYRYNESVDNEERVYQVLEWLDMPPEERPSLVVLYTHIVDTAGHNGGPFSAMVDQTLGRADAMVEMIMNGLRDRGLDTCVNFMITSDHGMASVDCQNDVSYLEDYGVNMSEVYFDGGPYARIGKSPDKSLWKNFDAVDTKKKLACKRDETHWEAFLKYEYLPKRFHYANDPWIEDLHLVMDEEWWVDGESEDGPGCVPGGHGYDNLYPDMRAFFTGHGSALKRNYNRSAPFQNIELYNLFTDLLGITAAENNGTRGSLYDIMTNSPVLNKEGTGLNPNTCPYQAGENSNDLGCDGCEGIVNEEANEMLNLESSQVTEYQNQHMLYGRPRIFDEEAEYCILTQRNYVTTYDTALKMPRLSSFVLQKGGEMRASADCVRRDVRLPDDVVTPCSDYAQTSGVAWKFLFSPGLAEDEAKSDATLSSNVVPAYSAFSEIWDFMANSMSSWATLYNGITVDVGPIFDYDYNGIADVEDVRTNNGSFVAGDQSTPIPTHFFILMTRCKDRSAGRTVTECSEDVNDIEALSFIIPNYKESPCHQENSSPGDWIPAALARHISRVKDIELLTKISFFSEWVWGDEANEESNLASIGLKLAVPEVSNSWLQDFLSNVSPSPAPLETTTSRASVCGCSLVTLWFNLVLGFGVLRMFPIE